LLLTGLASSSADRRMGRRMNDEAARLRKILDTAMDAFVSFDDEGRVTYWSAQAEAMFGWRREEIVGQAHFDVLVPERHRAGRRDAFKRFRETGAGLTINQRLELPVLHRDGRELPVELTCSVMWTEGRASLNAFARDISRRKEHEDDLIKAKNQAEAASRAKSAFLATMSHELRTPLNAILGFSEMIRDGMLGPRGAAAVPEYAGHIYGSGRHLLELINDILDLSNADSNQLKLRETDCDVAAAVTACVRTVEPQAHTAGVHLQVDLAGDLPRLIADERRLRQILVNLLSNAAKFTPAGGRVVVRAQVNARGELAIAVADTGIGMNPQEITTALAPFGQVDNRLSRKFEGTGLGLPITQRLLELHQGRLEIASSAGGGTTVTATFPATRLGPPMPPARAA
jgi:PAS domain S-box-containing protein